MDETNTQEQPEFPMHLMAKYTDIFIDLFARSHTVNDVRQTLYCYWRDIKEYEYKGDEQSYHCNSISSRGRNDGNTQTQGGPAVIENDNVAVCEAMVLLHSIVKFCPQWETFDLKSALEFAEYNKGRYAHLSAHVIDRLNAELSKRASASAAEQEEGR